MGPWKDKSLSVLVDYLMPADVRPKRDFVSQQVWYFVTDGQVAGPVNLERVAGEIRSGTREIAAVWSPGMSAWEPPSTAIAAWDRFQSKRAYWLASWSMGLGAVATASVRPGNPLGILVFPLSGIGLYLGIKAMRAGSNRAWIGIVWCSIVPVAFTAAMAALLISLVTH